MIRKSIIALGAFCALVTPAMADIFTKDWPWPPDKAHENGQVYKSFGRIAPDEDQLVTAVRILFTGSPHHSTRVVSMKKIGPERYEWGVVDEQDRFKVNQCSVKFESQFPLYFDQASPDFMEFQPNYVTLYKRDRQKFFTQITRPKKLSMEDFKEALFFVLQKCTIEGIQGKTPDSQGSYNTPMTGPSPTTDMNEIFQKEMEGEPQ